MHPGEKSLEEAVKAGIVERATLVKSPEEAGQEAGEDGFSVEAAFNVPHFAEFVANAKGSEDIDMSDSRKIAEMYHAFEDMNVATDGMQEFLEKNEGLHKIGVDISRGAFPTEIAKEMQRMAYEQPEELAVLADMIAQHKDTNDLIATAEASLLDLQGNVESGESMRATLDELRGRQGILNDARKVSGFFARKVAGIKALYERFAFSQSVEDDTKWLATHEEEPGGNHTRAGMEAFVKERSTARRLNDARLIVRDYYNIEIEPGAIKAEIADVERSIQAMEGRIAVSDALQQLKEQHHNNLDTLNMLIARTVSANKSFQQLALKQMEARLIGIASNPDAAFDYIEQVRSGGALIFDSKDIEKQTAEWTNTIQTAVEAAVTDSIEKAFRSASLGSNAFQNLEQSLSAFIDNARIGQKEGVDAQAFVMETLKSIIDRNKNDPKLRAKNILLRALVSKLSPGAGSVETEEAPEAIPLNLTPEPAPAASPAAPEASEAATPETEQTMDPQAEILLSEIMNFTEEDKLGGLPRVMEEVNGYKNRAAAQEAMRSDGFIDICIKILSGKWMKDIKGRPIGDTSVKHFTQLMNEFPSDTREAVLYSTDYLMAVTKELTTERKTGDLMYAAEIFGSHGVSEFPPYVQEMLRKDEHFLDTVVESLRIPEYDWDSKLMALCLEDVGEDFKDAVFNRPRFIQIFCDFLNGSYRSKKDEDMAEGLRILSPILGEKFMKNKEVKKITDNIKPAARPETKKAATQPAAQPKEQPRKRQTPPEPPRPQPKRAPDNKGVIDLEVVDAGQAASPEKKGFGRERGPIIDAVEEPAGPQAAEQQQVQPPIAIEENSARTLDAAQAAAAVEAAPTVTTEAAPAASQPESQPAATKEAQKEKAPKPRRIRPVSVSEEFNSLEEMVDAAGKPAPERAESNPAEFDETIRADFKRFGSDLAEFEESMRRYGFTSMNMDSDIDHLARINAQAFDPVEASKAIEYLHRFSLSPTMFLRETSESPSEEDLAAYKKAINEVERLEGRLSAMRKDIYAALPEEKEHAAAYAKISENLTKVLRRIRDRKENLSSAQTALMRYLDRR